MHQVKLQEDSRVVPRKGFLDIAGYSTMGKVEICIGDALSGLGREVTEIEGL